MVMTTLILCSQMSVQPLNPTITVIIVWKQGHRKQNTFFVTQMPLPDTRVDLWRLVEDYECIAIVMLNELQPEDEVGDV